jgi:hypothetical protein
MPHTTDELDNYYNSSTVQEIEAVPHKIGNQILVPKFLVTRNANGSKTDMS